jgi:hypothetical protein
MLYCFLRGTICRFFFSLIFLISNILSCPEQFSEDGSGTDDDEDEASKHDSGTDDDEDEASQHSDEDGAAKKTEGSGVGESSETIGERVKAKRVQEAEEKRLKEAAEGENLELEEGSSETEGERGKGKTKKKTKVTHAALLKMLQNGEDHDDPEPEADEVRSYGNTIDLGQDGGVGGFQFINLFSGLTPDSVLKDDRNWERGDDPGNIRLVREVSFDDSLLREETGMPDLTVISSVVVCTPRTGVGPERWHWDAPPEWILQYKLKNAFENLSESASYEIEAGDKRIVMKPGEALYGSALTLHRGSHLKHFGRVSVLFSELALNRNQLRVLRKKIKSLSRPNFTDLPDSWPSYSIFDPVNEEPPEDED